MWRICVCTCLLLAGCVSPKQTTYQPTVNLDRKAVEQEFYAVAQKYDSCSEAMDPVAMKFDDLVVADIIAPSFKVTCTPEENGWFLTVEFSMVGASYPVRLRDRMLIG